MRPENSPGDIHAALVHRAEKKNTSLRVETIETLRAAVGAEAKLDASFRRRIREIPSGARLDHFHKIPDAEYVALTRQLQARLVTTDEKVWS